MAIDTECKKCGETYRVKDELAGKKIRCKACSAVMLVPQLDEEEWDEEVPEEELPPVRKSSKKAKRKPSSDGIPISILLAAICVVAMLATTGYQLLQLVEVINQLQAVLNKPRAYGMITGSCLRGLVQLLVLIGVLRGTESTRTISIVLASVGLLLSLLVASRNMDSPVMVWTAIISRLGFIVSMMMPSSRDYMRN